MIYSSIKMLEDIEFLEEINFLEALVAYFGKNEKTTKRSSSIEEKEETQEKS